MKPVPFSFHAFALGLILSSFALHAAAQTCQTSEDLDDATRNTITMAGQRFFDMANKGDVTSMQQNAIPNLASDFTGISSAVTAFHQTRDAAQATLHGVFLLDATGAEAAAQSEFLCGVFGKAGQTQNSAVFYLSNLPPGKYAVVLFSSTAPKGRNSFSEILQQQGADWKLAGLYIEPADINGHDSNWFLDQARQYKTKGQLHNAWLYYREATKLAAPLSFMSTLTTDNLFDEAQKVKPADFPENDKPVDLVAAGATYKLTAIYPWVMGNDLNLFVKYMVSDLSNSNQVYQSNIAVINALVAKYPELRSAFPGVEAIAIDPAGHDYGTLLAVKDIK